MIVPDGLRAAMRSAGMDFAGPIVADGRLHRFRAEGDHARNSWYVLHDGTVPAGAFGCWKRGIKHSWCDRDAKQLTPAEREAVHRKILDAEQARERDEKLRQGKARKIAHWILSRSKPAEASHPYLIQKGVQAHGDLHQYRDALVLPLRDSEGVLHSLQFIGGDGEKRFFSGGRVEGCYYTVADTGTGPLVICEGYATGASIFEATGYATVAAMNCGNLLSVAKGIRAKFPKRDIIIAGDNDQFKEGNPGRTKATEAARAIGIKLAIPQFKSTESKPTDFNDLANVILEGLPAVKAQIDTATVPAETPEMAIARLAALTPLEYEKQRKEAADKLEFRISALDAMVEAARGGNASDAQGHTVDLPDIEPWPDPVDGAALLDEVAHDISEYVALPGGAADVLALWIAHTHCFDAFQCSPRLNVTSPDKGCGKTVLCDVLASFAPRQLRAENLSVAVLFRMVEAHRPTVFADEYDSWIHDNEELRGLLNAGHRRGGQALRCEGGSNEVRAFTVFGPVVLAGIGTLPGTLYDRSIGIKLVRAKPGEVRKRFDSRHIEYEQELCRKLARWCADNRVRIEACDPALPDGAFNRLADNWRPLFAIAEVAGGDWPDRARRAFALLTASQDQDAQGIGIMLLTDIRQVFHEAGSTRLFSKALIEKLLALTDRPWGECRGKTQKPITENWLAHRLKTFGIAPKTLRIGEERAKGYELQDFQEAFDRYIPDTPMSNRDGVTIQSGVEKTEGTNRDNEKACHGSETQETAENIALSRCHDLKTPTVAEDDGIYDEPTTDI
jgi:putative DNA primase/helicase